MKRSDENRLLNQILADDVEDFRRASLELALRQNRQRRRTQSRMTVVGLIVVVAGWGVLRSAKPTAKPVPPIQTTAITQPAKPVAVSAPAAKVESHVKILTDEELFALFPNRQVALIGKPGHQQLIFLDGPNHEPIVAGEQVN